MASSPAITGAELLFADRHIAAVVDMTAQLRIHGLPDIAFRRLQQAGEQRRVQLVAADIEKADVTAGPVKLPRDGRAPGGISVGQMRNIDQRQRQVFPVSTVEAIINP